MQRARTETFEHTISGLISKRADLLSEASELRDRLAVIRNDIVALDRTLKVVGYSDDPNSALPHRKLKIIFGQGELSRLIFDQLKKAPKPLSNREVAREIIAMRGQDAGDRTLLADFIKRVGKALGKMRVAGAVSSLPDELGAMRWKIIK